MADSRPDPMVSAAWLAERLDAPDIRVIDASWYMPADNKDPRALYNERRIPGAIFFDIDEIADHDTDLPHMLPSSELFASRMRKLGIGDGARIVIYNNEGIMTAARVWWTLRVMGHEDVSVLDGGFPAWEAGHFPIETDAPTLHGERHFTVQRRGDLVRDVDDVRRAVTNHSAAILDARPAARFTGEAPEPRAGLRGGHMPGAASVPSSTLVENGFLKSREELEKIFADKSADFRQPIICTCGSGITAAIIALALARLGRWDASVYDGSWAEWGGLADTPVVTGA